MMEHAKPDPDTIEVIVSYLRYVSSEMRSIPLDRRTTDEKRLMARSEYLATDIENYFGIEADTTT